MSHGEGEGESCGDVEMGHTMTTLRVPRRPTPVWKRGTKARLLKKLVCVLISAFCSFWYVRTQWGMKTAVVPRSFGGKFESFGMAAKSASQRKPKYSPRHIYWCGLAKPMFTMDINVGHSLFPEVNVTELKADSSISANDVLLYPCTGRCPVPFEDFPGKIITFNFEPKRHWRCPKQKEGLYEVSTVDATNPNVSTYFASMYLQGLCMEWQNKFYKPEFHPINTKERFLIYAASHCVPHREDAFTNLSSIGPVDHGGHCRGRTTNQNANITQVPLHGSAYDNFKYFGRYRFALVMENNKAKGYISEKIVNAFLAGCIPIYYGTEEVFNIFNRKSFIFYDAANPKPALERVAYLERNRTAYDMVLEEPILANGTYTIEKYFSWSDEVGGGQLKWKIRELVGYD